MKIPISEVRKQLPSLVRKVRKNAGARIQITVHDEVVAELRRPQLETEPGAAAQTLLALMKKIPKHRGRKTTVSTRANKYLHGSRRTNES